MTRSLEKRALDPQKVKIIQDDVKEIYHKEIIIAAVMLSNFKKLH